MKDIKDKYQAPGFLGGMSKTSSVEKLRVQDARFLWMSPPYSTHIYIHLNQWFGGAWLLCRWMYLVVTLWTLWKSARFFPLHSSNPFKTLHSSHWSPFKSIHLQAKWNPHHWGGLGGGFSLWNTLTSQRFSVVSREKDQLNRFSKVICFLLNGFCYGVIEWKTEFGTSWGLLFIWNRF